MLMMDFIHSALTNMFRRYYDHLQGDITRNKKYECA